jgi:hypothetical protein
VSWDYEIVSLSGRIWTRAMVRTATRRRVRRIWGGCGWCRRLLELVDVVLDDDRWMRRKRGYVPAAVARDVEEEAANRYYEELARREPRPAPTRSSGR